MIQEYFVVNEPVPAMGVVNAFIGKLNLSEVKTESYVGYIGREKNGMWRHKPVTHTRVLPKESTLQQSPLLELRYHGNLPEQIGGTDEWGQLDSWLIVEGMQLTPQIVKEVQRELGLTPVAPSHEIKF